MSDSPQERKNFRFLMDYKSTVWVGTKVLKSLAERPWATKPLNTRPLAFGTVRKRARYRPECGHEASDCDLRPHAYSKLYFACSVSTYVTRFVILCCTWDSCPWLMLEKRGPQTGMSWLP